jgi:hypothetical protein
MKRSSHFRTFSILLATFALAVMAGCASVKPQGDQQTVYAAGGTVGSVLIAANAYQALNSCAKPAHTLPCSDDATVAKIQVAKVKLVEAYKEADRIVNSPEYAAGDFAKAEAILNGALLFLESLVPTL